MPEPSSPTEPPELAALAPDPWADRLWRWRRSLVASMPIAVGLVVAATAIRILLDRLIGDATPFITYFPAIMIATLAGGLRAGIAATILSGLASWVLFVPPPAARGATGRPLIAVFAASALVAVLAAALFNALAERVLARHRSVLLIR